MGFLGVRFEVGVGGGAKLPRLKVIRIMLETWDSVLSTPTRTCAVSQNIPFEYLDPLNFADVSIFCKNSQFFGKNSTFTQSNSDRAVFEIF